MKNRNKPPIDFKYNDKYETATFSMGWFWGPDAWFGLLDGVIRTRVGYAGGTTENPNYHNIGDYTETLEIDFDPDIISFEKIADIYWKSVDPYIKPYSKQYASLFFYHDERQKTILEQEKKNREQTGKKVYINIIPYTKFYFAEGYHQKYYLQLRKEIFNAVRDMYENFTEFVNSTAAARINGYVKGYGSIEKLKDDIELLRLPDKEKGLLFDIVKGFGK